MIQELLGQTNFAGRDGFYWWMGQIETEKGGQVKTNDDRYKVRIVGHHLKDCNAVSHDDLPWAIVMMPATAPRREGNTDFQSVKYKSGDWVIGFFLDGMNGQQPVILGSIGQQTASTKEVGKEKPAAQCLAFTTFLDRDVNVGTTVPQDKKNAVESGGVSGTKGGATPGGTPVDLRGSVNASNETASTALLGTKCCNDALNPGGEYFCVEISDAKCESGDSNTSKLEFALTELFGAVSSSGGSAGTSLVSKYTGKLYDYIGIAQGYIGKVKRISNSIVARVKGEIFTLIKSGAKEILSFLLTTEVIDPTKPETFVGPYKSSTEAVQPAKKRVGRLRGITKWINDQLKNVNCVMEDLDARLAAFLEELIFGYLEQVINSAKCLIDSIVQDILNEIASFLDGIINAILGPLQALLSIIANPLNILGAALKQIFDLLGISCGGADNSCAAKEEATNCSGNCGQPSKEEDGDFLDGLIAGIENGNLDSSSGTCSDAYSPPKTSPTVIEIVGGVPDEEGYTGSQPNIVPPNKDPLDDAIDNALFPPGDGGGDEGGDGGGGGGGDGGDTSDNPSIITPPIIIPDTNPPEIIPPVVIVPGLLDEVNVDYNSSIDINISGSSSNIIFINKDESTPPTTIQQININSTVPLELSSNSIFVYTPINVTPSSISYSLSVNKTRVKEGSNIKFTLVANGGVVPERTVFNYVMFGSITSEDFLDQTTLGIMEMYGNIAEKTIAIAEDTTVEGDELVIFNVLQAAVAVPFTIIGSETSGTPESPPTIPAFTPPIIGVPEVCDDGRVMYIPIAERGDRYRVPPIVRVRGAGFGASAVAELNQEGYLNNIKITRSGTGYAPTRVYTNCYLSNFVVSSPGIGYYEEPTVYVNGDSSIAKAKIDERGFVKTLEVVNKTKIFTCTPRVEITSANGLGAKAYPIMECRSEELYKEYVANVAPSGVDEVVDCP